MQLLLGAIIGGLIQACGTLVGRVLLSLGIGYATYTGIDASISFARDQMFSGLSTMGANALRVAGAMRMGECISIISSALVARMTIRGLTSGAMKKFTMK